MPTYTYRRKSTGEEWTEFLPVADRDKPLEDPDVELCLMAPRLMAERYMSAHKKTDKFHAEVLQPKIDFLKNHGHPKKR